VSEGQERKVNTNPFQRFSVVAEDEGKTTHCLPIIAFGLVLATVFI